MSGLLNLTADDFGNKLRRELCKGTAGSFSSHNLGHLLPDGFDLRSSGVCSLLDLIRAAFGKGNGEETEEVVICGLDCDVGFDQSLPLSNQGSEFVGGEVKTMEDAALEGVVCVLETGGSVNKSLSHTLKIR